MEHQSSGEGDVLSEKHFEDPDPLDDPEDLNNIMPSPSKCSEEDFTMADINDTLNKSSKVTLTE